MREGVSWEVWELYANLTPEDVWDEAHRINATMKGVVM